MTIEINLIELSEALALNEVTKIYGEEALYRNNYDEFRGLVMHDTVKESYKKIYNKYYDAIISIIKKKDACQS
jgi:hypothetical protein